MKKLKMPLKVKREYVLEIAIDKSVAPFINVDTECINTVGDNCHVRDSLFKILVDEDLPVFTSPDSIYSISLKFEPVMTTNGELLAIRVFKYNFE